jgi:hypothetical protein
MNDRIIKFSHSDLLWSFGSKNPYIMLPTLPYHHTEYVDPFPCYSHDLDYITKIAASCEETINLKFKPQYFIMPFESESRTNAYACENKDYPEKDSEAKLNPYIVFHGKRICIHPAMSRYLVAHELGHIIHYNLEAIMKVDNDDFKKEYASLRGVDFHKKYGGLNWHNSISEIIANDIRILLFGNELEFWQHEVCFPTKSPKVVDFWKEMKNKYLS